MTFAGESSPRTAFLARSPFGSGFESHAGAPDEQSISEMAARFDVTMRTLRFYEEKGLLHPRRAGSRRYYGAACRARLELILQGKGMGMGLDDIAALVAAMEAGGGEAERAGRLRALCERQLEDLVARRAQLDEQIAETRKALEALPAA